MKSKSASATVTVSFDWTDGVPSADTISTSTWSVFPTGPTIGAGSTTGKTTSTSFAGGTLGYFYVVKNVVVTSSGFTDARIETVTILDSEVA